MICDYEISRIIFQYCRPTIVKYDGWFWQYAYDWQNLIAGSFALLGGVLLACQIGIQKTDIKQKEKQRLTAARMRLPHALSDIHRYLDQVFNVWRDKDPTKIAQLSQSTLDCIIENGCLTDAKTFECLSKLVRFLQVHETRLGDSSQINYYDLMLIDMARLKYLIDKLYPYGRFTVDAVTYKDPNREDLECELSKPTWVFELQDDDPIHARIKKALDDKFGPKPV